MKTKPSAIAQIEAAVRRAYSLGQTYWQQADSEYTSQHKKADVTAATFKQLVADTETAMREHDAELAAIAQPASPVQASPVTNADIDAAREALDSLDDFSRMTVGVNAIGPRGVLERFIANVAAIAQPLQQTPVRQPLTDAEITSLAYDCDALPEVVTDKTLIDFVRAIEAVHGIGTDK